MKNRTKKKLSREAKKAKDIAQTYGKRTCQMLANQKKRAEEHGVAIPYDLASLRAKVAMALSGPEGGQCPHCKKALTAYNFSADHIEPISRGGSWGLENVEIVCKACNEVKGPLSRVEFKQLINAIAEWPEEIRVNLFARIKAGGRFAKLNQKKACHETQPKPE